MGRGQPSKGTIKSAKRSAAGLAPATTAASVDDSALRAVADPSEDRSAQALRLLRANGFLLETVHTRDGYMEFVGGRIDDLGCSVPYVVGVADRGFEVADVDHLRLTARTNRAALVLVGDELPDGEDGLRWPTFVAKLGGTLPSLLPLDRDYGRNLIALGRNELPDGLEGEPSDLYEVYVHAGLEFMLGSRVVRYGQTRRFKAVPDGLMLPTLEEAAFLYDTKAYNPSFNCERDDVRRFADYVKRYQEQYARLTGPARAFLVVSTAFKQNDSGRQDMSNQLMADALVPLVFLTSQDLADMVKLLLDRPWARNVLRWRELMATLNLRASVVEAALQEIRQDGVRN